MKTKQYSKMTESQYFELLTKGGFFLNGAYFQQHKISGTLDTCLQYCNDNTYLQDKYNRNIIWKYGKRFHVTYGNN